jgi:DNA-binding beta-propeller fold protein YncE
MIRPLLALWFAVLLCPVAAHAQVFAPVAGTGCVGQKEAGAFSGPPSGCQLTGMQLIGVGPLALGDDLYALSDMGGVAALAPQAGGGLALAHCISDDATSGAPGSYGACADGDALRLPPLGTDALPDLALGPDGRDLYVSGPAGVAWLRRTADGLVSVGCFTDVPRGDRCTATGMLGLPSGIVVSPDGRSVYVADAARDAVVTFARDPGTGALRADGCISESGSDGQCLKGAGLYHTTGLAIAPDGSAVYAVGTLADYETSEEHAALAVLTRDAATGRLAPASCAVAAEVDTGVCVAAPRLLGASDLAVSPDGRFLYAAPGPDADAGALAIFAIDGTRVVPAGCLVGTYSNTGNEAGDCLGVVGLGSPRGVTISPAGTLAVVAAEGGLYGFGRDPATGSLREAWCVSGEAGTCAAVADDGDPGFDGVLFSSDGQRLSASAGSRNAVFALAPTAGLARAARVREGARTVRLRVACPRAARGGCRGMVRLGGSRAGYALARGHGRAVVVRLPRALRSVLRRTRAADAAVTVQAEHRLAATQRVRLTLR